MKGKTNGTDEVVKVLKENLEFNEDDIPDLKRDSKEVEHEVFELKKQILYLETYSRRENAKFFALPGEPSTSKMGKECKMAHSFQQKTPKKLFTTF